MELTKNVDPDKYGYSGSGVEFDARSMFSINGEWGKEVVDNSLSVHTDNRKKR